MWCSNFHDVGKKDAYKYIVHLYMYMYMISTWVYSTLLPCIYSMSPPLLPYPSLPYPTFTRAHMYICRGE